MRHAKDLADEVSYRRRGALVRYLSRALPVFVAALASVRLECDGFQVSERKPLYPGRDHVEGDSDIVSLVSYWERLCTASHPKIEH